MRTGPNSLADLKKKISLFFYQALNNKYPWSSLHIFHFTKHKKFLKFTGSSLQVWRNIFFLFYQAKKKSLNILGLLWRRNIYIYLYIKQKTPWTYSHLSNNRGGWNKRGGSAKVAKSINVEAGINMEGGIFWKKLVHKCNKHGVEGGKNLRNQ